MNGQLPSQQKYPTHPEPLGQPKPSLPEITPDTNTSGTVTVKLLQAARIPAGYKKMVRVVVDAPVSKDLLLFTPELDNPTLSVEDGAFQLDGGKHLTLIVANIGEQPLKLK